MGSGWWEARLHEYAAEQGAGDIVVFEGHVDEERKHEIYERAWLLALPSLKEGWGLVVGEAGMHRTPTVAYRSAGGTRESVVDGRSGRPGRRPGRRSRAAIADAARRPRPSASGSGHGALEISHAFSWGHAQRSFALVVLAALQACASTRRTPSTHQTSAGRASDGRDREGVTC